jgi:hypothetical protein
LDLKQEIQIQIHLILYCYIAGAWYWGRYHIWPVPVCTFWNAIYCTLFNSFPLFFFSLYLMFSFVIRCYFFFVQLDFKFKEDSFFITIKVLKLIFLLWHEN